MFNIKKLSFLGAIQIIRDTLGGRSRLCHPIGEVGDSPKCHVAFFFCSFLNNNFPIWAVHSLEKAFGKGKMTRLSGVGGLLASVTKWHISEGRGVWNSPKKCHVLFEWPFRQIKIY